MADFTTIFVESDHDHILHDVVASLNEESVLNLACTCKAIFAKINAHRRWRPNVRVYINAEENNACHLTAAAALGNLDLVKKYFDPEDVSNVCCTDADLRTNPLVVAAKHDFDFICEYLLQFEVVLGSWRLLDEAMKAVTANGSMSCLKRLHRVYSNRVEESETSSNATLHLACLSGQSEMVKYYVEELRENVNESDACEIVDEGVFLKGAPLWFAGLQCENRTTIDYLVSKGAALTFALKTEDQKLQLHRALESSVGLAKYLVEEKAYEVNPGDVTNAVFRNAIDKCKDPRLIEFLIKHGADFKGPIYGRGNTALHYAAGYKPHLVPCLLESGASVNAVSDDLQSPFHFAARVKFDVVEHLEAFLRHGADPNLLDKEGKTPLFHVVENEFLRTKIDEAIKIMIKSGSNVNSQAKDGKTILMAALSRSNAKYSTIKLLIETGVAVKDKVDRRGWPAIYYALKRTDLTHLLISHGAALNHHCFSGVSLIESALIHLSECNFELVKLLITHGAESDICLKNGESLLQKFIGKSHFQMSDDEKSKILTFLLDSMSCNNKSAIYGSNIKTGDTILHTIVLCKMNSLASVCKLLVEKAGVQVHINTRNGQGRTPLFHLIANSNTNNDIDPDLIKYLLELGSDTNVTDITGRNMMEEPRCSCINVIHDYLNEFPGNNKKRKIN